MDDEQRDRQRDEQGHGRGDERDHERRAARTGAPSPQRSMRALGEYLRARRALVRPEDLGFADAGNRRVAGLRREEVAAAAGISSEYYLRLEQGRDHQPSEPVIAALTTALRLDEHGAAHLRQLVHGRPPRPRQPDRTLSAAVLALVEHLGDVAVVVLDRNQDVLFANRAARRLAPSMRPGANRLVTLFDPASTETPTDLRAARRSAVAAFRRDGVVDDPRFREIVGALSLDSADFRDVWARHDVGPLLGGGLRVEVPPFGTLELRAQPFAVPDRAQTVVTISGEPGSNASAALAAFAVEGRTGGFGPAPDPRVRPAGDATP